MAAPTESQAKTQIAAIIASAQSKKPAADGKDQPAANQIQAAGNGGSGGSGGAASSQFATFRALTGPILQTVLGIDDSKRRDQILTEMEAVIARHTTTAGTGSGGVGVDTSALDAAHEMVTEILEMNASLEATNTKLQDAAKESADQKQCAICFDADRSIRFEPCGHVVCCVGCSGGVVDCPTCRVPITGRQKTIFS